MKVGIIKGRPNPFKERVGAPSTLFFEFLLVRVNTSPRQQTLTPPLHEVNPCPVTLCFISAPSLPPFAPSNNRGLFYFRFLLKLPAAPVVCCAVSAACCGEMHFHDSTLSVSEIGDIESLLFHHRVFRNLAAK